MEAIQNGQEKVMELRSRQEASTNKGQGIVGNKAIKRDLEKLTTKASGETYRVVQKKSRGNLEKAGGEQTTLGNGQREANLNNVVFAPMAHIGKLESKKHAVEAVLEVYELEATLNGSVGTAKMKMNNGDRAQKGCKRQEILQEKETLPAAREGAMMLPTTEGMPLGESKCPIGSGRKSAKQGSLATWKLNQLHNSNKLVSLEKYR